MRNCVILFYTCREKSFADSVWVQGPEENREGKEEKGDQGEFLVFVLLIHHTSRHTTPHGQEQKSLQ